MNNDTPLKRCSKCKEELPATPEYFVIDRRKKGGIGSWCRKCKKAYIRTPEYLATRREYYRTPRQQEYHKQYVRSAKRKEYTRQYNKSEQGRARSKKHSQTENRKLAERERQKKRYHTPEGKKRQREYNNKPERKQWHREYRQSSKGRAVAATSRNRRLARKQSLPDTFTVKQWECALSYFNGCCAVCGRQLVDLFGTHTAAMDHWIPLSSPDCPGTIAANMVPLCHGIGGCNNRKNNRDATIWLFEEFNPQRATKILMKVQKYFEWLNA